MEKINKYYCIVSHKKDEKKIVTAINDFLATLNRTMSKTKNKSLLSARSLYAYKYYYWNLNKETGTYFELFVNQDETGRWRYEKHQNCAWILKVRYLIDFPNFDENKSPAFIRKVLDAPELDYILIEEKEDED